MPFAPIAGCEYVWLPCATLRAALDEGLFEAHKGAMTAWAVHPLHLADVVYPEWHPRTGTGPVFGFAVSGNEGYVLVDTGIGPPHQRIDEMYGPRRYPLVDALRDAGFVGAPAAIVLSHLHFDHCGGAALFAGVPTYVQRREWEAAREPRYTIPEFVQFVGANYVLIDGGHEAGPGVSIVPTPGHTPGHQSVAVETPEGVVIIAAQAAETADDWESHLAGQAVGENDEARRSLDVLASFSPVAAYFSHDARVWRPRTG